MHKGRDKAVEKLSDVTHKQFRNIIMSKIDDMSPKLDGLSRKDLLASISFFREGIELLYEGFDEIRSMVKSYLRKTGRLNWRQT